MADLNTDILARRAKALAAPLEQSVMPVGLVKLVTFFLGDGMYGIEEGEVRGVAQIGSVAPVPGAPPAIAGITMHLGDLLTVIDLRILLGISPYASDECKFLLILADGRGQLGLMVKAFGEMATAGDADVRAPMPAAADADQGLIRGVTHEGVIIINTTGLLAHPKINA